MTISGTSPLRFGYYSHHKCATGWTASILRELCAHTGYRFRTAHGPQQYGAAGSLRAWTCQEEVQFLAFTNAEIDEVRTLPAHRGVHVVRDPRDVLVSAYFSHRNSHPTEQWPKLRAHRDELQTLSKEGGLLREIEFSRPFLTAMRHWDYNQDGMLEIKMEELTAEPEPVFRRVLRHLGLLHEDARASTGVVQKLRQYANRGVYKLHHEGLLPLPIRLSVEETVHPEVLDSILEAYRFERMTNGRAKGEADPESHYRKGEPGDWKNHFTDRVSRAFQDAYGDIVTKLGYEESPE